KRTRICEGTVCRGTHGGRTAPTLPYACKKTEGKREIARMSFPLNVYFVAATSAFVTAALSLPLWRRWSLRMGLVDDPGHRKTHGQPMALAGGLAVMTGLLLPTLLGGLALIIHHGKSHFIEPLI